MRNVSIVSGTISHVESSVYEASGLSRSFFLWRRTEKRYSRTILKVVRKYREMVDCDCNCLFEMHHIHTHGMTDPFLSFSYHHHSMGEIVTIYSHILLYYIIAIIVLCSNNIF